MKKRLFLVSVLVAIAFLNTDAAVVTSQPESTYRNDPSVIVYYFHLSRRCTTCRAVEENARKAVAELWPAQVKTGEYKFMAINIELDDNEKIAKKAGVSGQALVVICGENKADITDKAFLYASDFQKIKTLLKESVEKVK